MSRVEDVKTVTGTITNPVYFLVIVALSISKHQYQILTTSQGNIIRGVHVSLLNCYHHQQPTTVGKMIYTPPIISWDSQVAWLKCLWIDGFLFCWAMHECSSLQTMFLDWNCRQNAQDWRSKEILTLRPRVVRQC